MNRQLLMHVVVPLVAFYGLRAVGVPVFAALLTGALLSLATAIHGLRGGRRIGGVQLFVLGTMTLTVVFSLISGDPRTLLVRNAWGTSALGLWALLTLLGSRPFLLTAGALALPEDKVPGWHRNWERHPPFRTLLRRCTAFWGIAFLADAALRVAMALTLPLDLVPALDDALLVVTIAIVVLFQRLYGRPFLRRHGLRLHGAEVVPATELAPEGAAGAGSGRPNR